MSDAGTHAPEDPFDDVARRFDERAASYDESEFHRALAAEVVRFAGRGDPGAFASGIHRVLDVATGTGLVLRAVPASEGDAGEASLELTGVDISAGMLEVARGELPGATLLQADATGALPFADASFDLVTCVTGLHLMADPADALRGWRRLLAPGGRVVVAAFRTDVERRHQHGTHDHLHARTGTPEALARVAADAGYAVVREQTWVTGDPPETCLLAELRPIMAG